MAGLTDAGKAAYLAGFVESARFASLHSADPGDAGAHELATDRQPIPWGPVAGDSVRSSAEVMWDIPAGAEFGFIGYWSDPQGGTFLGSRPLDARQSFPTEGTFMLRAGGLNERQVA